MAIINSSCTATPIVDTPLRRIDLLHGISPDEGLLTLRSTNYLGSRVEVVSIHLQPHEAIRLAALIAKLDINVNVDLVMVQRDGKYGAECTVCNEFFTDDKGRKGNNGISKAIEHCKKAHGSTGGVFRGKSAAADEG
jgi:hypothetical protein